MNEHGPFCACDLCDGSTVADPVRHILDAVCSAFGVDRGDLLGPDRSNRFRRARSAAYILVRELNGLSYPKLAKALGRGSHRTAMKGHTRALRMLEADSWFSERVARVRTILERDAA